MSYNMPHVFKNIFRSYSSQSCSLNTFLDNYVKDAYLARGHNRNLQLTIESLSKTQDAWRSIITPEEMKRLGLTRPLLQNTVLVENREFPYF